MVAAPSSPSSAETAKPKFSLRDLTQKYYWPVLGAITFAAMSVAALIVWGAFAIEKARIVEQPRPAQVLPADHMDDDSYSNTRETSASSPQEPSAIKQQAEPSAPLSSSPPISPSVAAPVANTQETPRDEKRIITLAPAPLPDVTEDTSDGPLPKIAEDGRRPWQVYGRPAPATTGPRVALVITDMGLSKLQTNQAVGALPLDVTLAFDAQGSTTGAWLYRARQLGYETLLALPLEPFDFPRSDPGPQTLLTNLQPDQNLSRLLTLLKRGSGYVGVTTTTGARFSSQPEAMRPMMEELNRRGLLYLDARIAPRSVADDVATTLKLPHASATLRLDSDLTAQAIDDVLNQLVKKALQAGKAIGVAQLSPLMLDRIVQWEKTLSAQGVTLVPLSAVVD